jgi:hypothetical protein
MEVVEMRFMRSVTDMREELEVSDTTLRPTSPNKAAI